MANENIVLTHLVAGTVISVAVMVLQVPMFFILFVKPGMHSPSSMSTSSNLEVVCLVLVVFAVWFRLAILRYSVHCAVVVNLFLITAAFAVVTAAAVLFTIRYPTSEQIDTNYDVYRFTTARTTVKCFLGLIWTITALVSLLLMNELMQVAREYCVAAPRKHRSRASDFASIQMSAFTE